MIFSLNESVSRCSHAAISDENESFLSCLYGSEQPFSLVPALMHFLSCLSGSEPRLSRERLGYCFLSCLSGSEPCGL